MRVLIRDSFEDVSRLAAQMVADLVRRKPDCVLGLATGSSPEPMYAELVRLHRDEGLDFSRVVSFNLDEYVDLPPTDENSYRYFMQQQLFDHVNIDPANTHVPDGMAADLDAHCREYEQMIREAGGIDLQVLGIGSDGHVAFNEPGASLGSRTRVVFLAEPTIEDNARFFASAEQVPRAALSMGVGTILEARQCLLLAKGVGKAKAVREAIEGPVTSMITASALQLHPDTTAFLDVDAACELELKDYFEHAERTRAELRSGQPAGRA